MVARGEEEDAVRRAHGEGGEEGEGAEHSGRACLAVGRERCTVFVARAVLRAGDLPLQIAQEPARGKLSSAHAFFARLLEEDRARALQKSNYFSVALKYRVCWRCSDIPVFSIRVRLQRIFLLLLCIPMNQMLLL
jgi:hypothetical protein